MTKPKYLCPAITRSIRSSWNTAWRRLLTFGRALVFIVSVNITKCCLITWLLPPIEFDRSSLNYGSPYWKVPKSGGRRPQLDIIGTLNSALWHIKGCDCLYRIFPVFGIVPSSSNIWLDYSLELLLRVVRKRTKLSQKYSSQPNC